VDEVCATIGPLLAGGESKRMIVGASLDPPLGLHLARVLEQDDTLLLRYVRA
jgi:riboflavin biosynthesis pyrimidine reductase